MALGALAQFISYFIAQPFSRGLANRKNFNLDPVAELDDAQHPERKVSGADLGAFLSFTRGEIALQVLKRVKDADPKLADPDNARDFSLWLYDFANWKFDPTEETQYPDPFPPKGQQQAQYNDPLCQIRQATPMNPVAVGSNRQIDLEIRGEGFLKGKTTVRIFSIAQGQYVGNPQQVDPDSASTFRGGLLTLQTVLSPGDYRAVVEIDLGDQTVFTIDKPHSAAKFTVA